MHICSGGEGSSLLAGYCSCAEVIGILGVDAIFMGNDMQCLGSTTDGKGDLFIHGSVHYHVFGSKRETKKTNQWPLIQTFCFPKQEDVKTKAQEVEYMRELF